MKKFSLSVIISSLRENPLHDEGNPKNKKNKKAGLLWTGYKTKKFLSSLKANIYIYALSVSREAKAVSKGEKKQKNIFT